jgi:signal transduction histidine kinase/ActR/RegA family two-component response regulator
VLSLDTAVFQTQQAIAALEKYAAVTHLTVRVYDRDERMIIAPIDSNALFELFTEGEEPHILGECVRRCFAETDASVIVVEDGHGLAVIGAPFTNEGKVVCAAVAAYALTGYPDQREIHRLARDSGLSFESLWRVVRKELPISRQRLPLFGELLRIIGETLLSEHHRSRQLEETLARLEVADRSKDEFLATLSHELRGPLNAIVGWTRVLRAGGLDHAVSARALEAIEQSTHEQTKLINDLLEVSRIVAGKLRLELQGVELIPVIEAVLDAVRIAANVKNIRLQVVLDPSVGLVSGDPDRLGQIFSNLLSNAVKFTPSGGKVTVTLDRADSDARITVNDTGQGISLHFLPHIFERFRQADSTITRSHSGLGLGLAIVRHLVELHGGTVRAESRGEGQGATFTVTLPLLNLPREQREKAIAPSRPSHPGLDGLRVWVVDDDAGARTMLKTILEMSGAQVTPLASAYEALKMLDESRPEVFVCDVSMPGMDGYTLMRQVRARASEHGGSVPAIAVTGYAAPEYHERALSAGYQTYFAKPIDLGGLTRAIVRLTGREASEAVV